MSDTKKHTAEAQTSPHSKNTDSTSPTRKSRPQGKSTAPLPTSSAADVASFSAASGRNSTSSTSGSGRTTRHGLSTEELITRVNKQIVDMQKRLVAKGELWKSNTLPASQQNYTPPINAATTTANIIPASDPVAKLREKIAQAKEMEIAMKAKEAARKRKLAEERKAKAARDEYYRKSNNTLGVLGIPATSNNTERLTGPDRFILEPNAFTGTPLGEKNKNAKLYRASGMQGSGESALPSKTANATTKQQTANENLNRSKPSKDSNKDTSKQQQKAAPANGKKRRRDTDADDQASEHEKKKIKSSLDNTKNSTPPSTDQENKMTSPKQAEAATNTTRSVNKKKNRDANEEGPKQPKKKAGPSWPPNNKPVLDNSTPAETDREITNESAEKAITAVSTRSAAVKNIDTDPSAPSKRGTSPKNERPVSKGPAEQANGQKVDVAEAARKVPQNKRARDDSEDEEDRPTSKKAKFETASEDSDKEEAKEIEPKDPHDMYTDEDGANETGEQDRPKEGEASTKTAHVDTIMTDDDGDAPNQPPPQTGAVQSGKPKKVKKATRSQIRNKYFLG